MNNPVTTALRAQVDTLVAEMIPLKNDNKRLARENANLRKHIKYLRGRTLWEFLFGSE